MNDVKCYYTYVAARNRPIASCDFKRFVIIYFPVFGTKVLINYSATKYFLHFASFPPNIQDLGYLREGAHSKIPFNYLLSITLTLGYLWDGKVNISSL